MLPTIMRLHPSDEELDAFLAARLSEGERNAVLLHLSWQCARCRRRLALRAYRILGKAVQAAPASDYDAVFDRAFDIAARQQRVLAGERQRVDEDLAALLATADLEISEPSESRRRGGWALTEELLARSHALRYRAPARMVRFAELARHVASRVRPEQYGAGPVADLEARTQAVLANAYRVSDDLESADGAMRIAFERLEEGTGDLSLKAYLLALKAALRQEERRYAESSRLLDRAHSLYLRTGERQMATRTLVSHGAYLGWSGDLAGGLKLLVTALTRIDPTQDPKLAAMARQNILWLLVLSGRFSEARARLACDDLRRILADEPLALVRLEWLEGRIALGLGDSKRAERAFLATQEALLAVGQHRDARLLAQDLAAVRQGSPPYSPI